VWAANGMGQVEALDLRAGRMSGTLKGAGGSVRALSLHPGGEPLIASAGLDRFVRIHSTSTRANLGRAYTKQQLTAVAWVPALASAVVPAHAEAGSAADSVGRATQGKHQRRQQQHPSDIGSGEDEGAGAAGTSGEGDDSSKDDSDSGSDSDDSGSSSSSEDEGAGKRRGGRQPMGVQKHQGSGGKRRKGRGGGRGPGAMASKKRRQ
jgi:hypothetical protein